MRDDERAAVIERDWREAELSGRERAILEYAVKLARTPEDMERSDVEELRRAGLDDSEIFDVCHVTSYYSYVNRIADGLGVELEGYWDSEEEEN